MEPPWPLFYFGVPISATYRWRTGRLPRFAPAPGIGCACNGSDDWGALVKALMFSGLWGNRPVAMSIVLAGIDIVVEAITATPSCRITHSDIISSQCRALAAPDLIGLGAIFALLLQRG